MASLFASGPEASGLTGFPVCFPFPYSVEHYISQESARHDIWPFVVIPDYPGHLSVLHGNISRDTVAEA